MRPPFLAISAAMPGDLVHVFDAHKLTLSVGLLLRVVQGILVRNYADTQKLDVEVIGSSIYVEGEFVMFDYNPARKKAEDRIEADLGVKRTLLHIEQQIRGLGEVTHLE